MSFLLFYVLRTITEAKQWAGRSQGDESLSQVISQGGESSSQIIWPGAPCIKFERYRLAMQQILWQ